MPEKEKKRLSRLAAILTQLQSKRLVTATELAEKHQVSIRTIYRDIRTLEESGVPITVIEGKGYSLVEGYQLPPISLTENEANALITAEQFISRNKDESLVKNYQEAITKIKSVLRNSEKEKAELLSKRIAFRSNPELDTTSNYLSQIQWAITNYKLCKLSYSSLEKQQSERMVEPFALYSTQENWIMIAYCRLRKEFRSFRLDRIIKFTKLNESFEPHNMTLREYYEKTLH